MDLVTATDLSQWAERRDAQALLPQLVRRLIAATADGLSRLTFRAGEGVALPGWDGIVEAARASAFVPAASSGWEMGVGDPGPKANEDYHKRTREPGEVDPARSTFVFVTPRRWPGKAAWVAERQAEGTWAAVIAYDADDLETWLESALAVHTWISALLGKDPYDAESLETWWASWSGATRPPLPPALVLSGRDQEADLLRAVFQGEPATVSVVADSQSEALAFVAASILTQADSSLMERALVVRSPQAWRRLSVTPSPLVLAPTFDRPVVAPAIEAGHHVVLPFGREVATARGIELPRLRRAGIEASLIGTNMPRDRASTLATLGRRSLLSLRRALALNPDAEIPAWATPEHAPDIVPAVLAGSWDEMFEGDREAVAILAGRPYGEYVRALTRWLNASDPPVRRVGNVWLIGAKVDAWSLTARALTTEDLDRFREVATRVVGEDDPALDLPREQRVIAGILGRQRRYSGHLARGLADTLALMATTSDDVPLAGGRRGETEALVVTRSLVVAANEDPTGRRWHALAGQLPLLAEASPTEVLRAIEGGSQTSQGPVLRLFQDGGPYDALSSGSPHSSLLWALETLAWSPEHLPHAALRLAALARLEPGGRTLNRPFNSLRDVLLFWRPGTAASLEQRLDVVDLLRRREPDIAWGLVLALIPGNGESASSTSSPDHRDWKPDAIGDVTIGDLVRAADALVERGIEDAGVNGRRWAALLSRVASTGLPARDRVINAVEQLDPATLSPDGRTDLYRAVRGLVNKHRQFPGADWAMPADALDRLENRLSVLEPKAATARHGWLFEQRALDAFVNSNRDERRRTLGEAQDSALAEILADVGLDGLLDWAATLSSDGFSALQIGEALARTETDPATVLARLGSAREMDRRVAAQYVGGMTRARGLAWAEDALARFGSEWPPEHQALFLRALPACGQVWDVAERLGPDVDRLYWAGAHPYELPAKGDEGRLAAEKLVAAGHARTALHQLAMLAHDGPDEVPAELLARALEAAVAQTTEPIDGTLAQYIAEHLERLDDAGFDPDRLAQLEWAYLPLFRYDRRPSRVLHRALAEDPAFFVQAVTLVYRARGEDPGEPSEAELAIARSASDLLDAWRTVPGMKPDGALDAPALLTWVREARRLLDEASRLEPGDRAIGRVLRYGPPFRVLQGDTAESIDNAEGEAVPHDGEWPAEEIRDAIEEVASEHLERGLEREVYNSRGVTMRGQTEGGMQERALAERYRRHAAAAGMRWPRTAAMLTRIAAVFEEDAGRNDRDADLTEDTWR